MRWWYRGTMPRRGPYSRYLRVFPAEHLLEVCAHVQGQTLLQPCGPAPVAPIDGQHVELADIKPQYHAKRALESPQAVATTSDIMSALTLPVT